MSALLRALMAQQNGGDKLNLAIETEDLNVPIDSLGASGLIRVCAKIGAKLQAGKKYNVSFAVDFDLKERTPTGNHDFFIGNYGFWHSNNIFGRINGIHNSFSNYKADEKNVECFLTDNGNDKTVICFFTQGYKGTVRIYNVVITEV